MFRLPSLLLASTLMAGSLTGAFAQAAPPPAPKPPAAAPADPAPNAAEIRREADRQAFFEARLAALHAGLALTPDQEKMWPPVEQAIRKFVKVRAELQDQRSDARQDRDDTDAEDDTDYIAALRTYADGQAERADALKRLADAAGPLYATLSEDQRHRIPLLLQAMAPRHHGGAMSGMGRHHGGRHDWSDDMNAQPGGLYGGHREDRDRDDHDAD